MECVWLLGLVVLGGVDGAALLLSSRSFHYPSLALFDEEGLRRLLHQLADPFVLAFSDEAPALDAVYAALLANRHSAFVPLADVHVENSTVLSGSPAEKLHQVDRGLRDAEAQHGKDNVLCILLGEERRRFERSAPNPPPSTSSAEDAASSTSSSSSSSSAVWMDARDSDTGPVVFFSKKDALIYMSGPMVVRQDDGKVTSISIRREPLVTFDQRERLSRVSVTIVGEDQKKITIRFKFATDANTWTLTTIELIEAQSKLLMLAVVEDAISAPFFISYHCSGSTIFGNTTANITLKDLQVQLKLRFPRKFGQAFDCIGFTSPGILMGAFVCTFLCLGLFVGINSLFQIKTMDKFDRTSGLNFASVQD